MGLPGDWPPAPSIPCVEHGREGLRRRSVSTAYTESVAIHSEYIEQRDEGYYVAGTRISLDSVVYAFNEGQSPEAIQEDFPLLKRSQIYGAIAYYLDRQAVIDEYLARTEREFEGSAITCQQANPSLWENMD